MTAATVRWYRITHETAYDYSDRVKSSYGRGYLVPRTTENQTCVDSSVMVVPVPSDRSTGTDVYGNEDFYFHVTSDHTRLVVTSTSLVSVAPPDPAIVSSPQATSPWEQSRPGRDEAAEFVLDLVPGEITDEVTAYARQSFTGGRSLIDAVIDLTHRIFRDFTYLSGSTTVSTKVADVLVARSGVCQDFARLAIACCRSQGLAARYVSGYLATDPPPGKERMVGVDATHAWAAVWIPGGRWIAFDPTNDQLVDERYTTVAWGRDYADVPPLRGVIYTDSEKSTIAVAVDVEPIDNFE